MCFMFFIYVSNSFTKNEKVTIKSDGGDLIFENEGEPLKFDLEKYFEPFFSSEVNNKDSFGLGLYIIFNILKANHYTLEYSHENGYDRRTDHRIVPRVPRSVRPIVELSSHV